MVAKSKARGRVRGLPTRPCTAGDKRDDGNVNTEVVQREMRRELVRRGIPKTYVDAALQECRSLEEALHWLTGNAEEDGGETNDDDDDDPALADESGMAEFDVADEAGEGVGNTATIGCADMLDAASGAEEDVIFPSADTSNAADAAEERAQAHTAATAAAEEVATARNAVANGSRPPPSPIVKLKARDASGWWRGAAQRWKCLLASR
jgi:hypothetical protein